MLRGSGPLVVAHRTKRGGQEVFSGVMAKCRYTFGLMWDVPEPPVSIYNRATSSAGFPFNPLLSDYDPSC